MDKYQSYRDGLNRRFQDYWEGTNRPSSDFLDSKHGQGRLPVFRAEHAELNVLTNPKATNEDRRRLLSLIPESKHHKWFRSMSSSQALALSFFGNFAVHGQLDWLRDLEDDDGKAVFGTADLSAYNFSMEHEIGMLNEPRPTSLDVFISGRYRVAIECKLSETEFGACSRPGLSKESPEYCDGSYTVQGGRKNRCALTEIGVRYWDYVPKLFKWPADEDYAECPLRDSYQLVRNVLAACVREDGVVSQENGLAVVVYDKRNPAFADGGKGAEVFQFTRGALRDSQNLGKVSWQNISSFMMRNKKLSWLTDAINDKYGIGQG